MSKIIHVGNVSTSKNLQDGYYDLRIASATAGHTPSGILRYTLEFRVVAPEGFANRGHFEDFNFGKKPWTVQSGKNYSDEYIRFLQLEDLEAEDALTHQMSPMIRAFKKLMQDMQHPEANASDYDMDAIVESLNIKNPAEQFRVGAFLKNSVDRNGKERLGISFTYAIGQHEPKLQAKAGASAASVARTPATKVRTRAAVAPVAPVAPVNIDDEDVD